jgi:LPXTG-site transpeptidase (sortase) family protein
MDTIQPVGHLYIPSQNIDEDIYFSRLSNRQWDRSVWDNGNVAWLDQTGWIDSDFNTALVSHTDGPLHDILWMAVGDLVYIEDDQYIATYVVTETIIEDVNDVLSVTSQTGGPRMTMSVCFGVNQRYIVRAERVSLEAKAVG